MKTNSINATTEFLLCTVYKWKKLKDFQVSRLMHVSYLTVVW